MIRTIIQDLLDTPAFMRLSSSKRAALEDIAACGTEACGLHREQCDHCGDKRLVPNTCGNRACPYCQGAEREAWVREREKELLPSSYFHVVATTPEELRGLSQAFPAVVNDVLLRSIADAVHYLAADPKHLGGEVGSLSMLHTWGSDLRLHPHAHVLVTAGAWNAEEGRWIHARCCGAQKRPFLVSVDVLRLAFQRRFMRLLLQAYEQGRFDDGPHEAFPFLAQLSTLRAFMGELIRKPWVVYIEPPFGSPQILLRYLGRYVNRVAISPSRVTAYDAEKDQVTFHWKDYAHKGRQESLTLSSAEFLQRFAQHIPPPGFVRIRFRGLWSTAHRKTKLAVVQAYFRARGGSGLTAAPPTPNPDPTATDHRRCPACGIGCYQRIPGDYRLPRKDRRKRIRELIAGRRTATPGGVATPA
jgi:hypothetical protein